MIEQIFFILLGLVCLLGGYTLYRWGIRAVGAYLGVLAGLGFWRVVEEFVLRPHMQGTFDYRIGLLISAVVFALLGAYLAMRFYMALLFFATFLGGLYIVYSGDIESGTRLLDAVQETQVFQFVYRYAHDLTPALFVLVVAALMMLLHKHMVIIVTSFTGAYLVAVYTFPYLFPAFLAVGLFSQFTAQRRGRRRRDDD